MERGCQPATGKDIKGFLNQNHSAQISAKESKQYHTGPKACALKKTSTKIKREENPTVHSPMRRALDGTNHGQANETPRRKNSGLGYAQKYVGDGVNAINELILIAKMADSGGVAHHEQLVATLREAVKKWVKSLKKHEEGSQDHKQNIMEVFKLLQNHMQMAKEQQAGEKLLIQDLLLNPGSTSVTF